MKLLLLLLLLSTSHLPWIKGWFIHNTRKVFNNKFPEDKKWTFAFYVCKQ